MRLEEVLPDLRHGKSIARKNDPVNRVITFDNSKMLFILSAFGESYNETIYPEFTVFDLVARDWYVIIDDTTQGVS
jgi:hypothetical protein